MDGRQVNVAKDALQGTQSIHPSCRSSENDKHQTNELLFGDPCESLICHVNPRIFPPSHRIQG